MLHQKRVAAHKKACNHSYNIKYTLLTQAILHNTLYVAIFCEVDIDSLRSLAKTGHTHDIAGESYNKATTCIEFDIFDIDFKTLYTTITLGIGTE